MNYRFGTFSNNLFRQNRNKKYSNETMSKYKAATLSLLYRFIDI